jgi:hypothetical protein
MMPDWRGFFEVPIGQIPVVGKFHSVGFKDGDHMEFVVSEHDGIVVSHAARCSHQRILWMLPYHVRGHKAQNRHDLKMNLLTSAALTIAGTILLHFEAPFDDFSSMALMTIANFLLSLLVLWWVRSHFWGFAEVTTSILQVFGYQNPEMADLSSDDKNARKTAGEKWSLPNWSFRY